MEKAQEARTKNDEGAAKDQATILVTGYIQDYLNAKYVSGTETASNEKAYITSRLQNGLQEGNYYIIVEDGTLNIYEDSTKTTKIAYGALQNNGTISWGIEAPVSLKIGDTINYSTTLNGVTLNNWKVFYVDGDYTYIILADYLPNSTVSNTFKTTYNLETSGTYSVHANNSREDLINAMTTTSNWTELVNNGEINGIALSSEVKNNKNVWAMGSPDLELWINSWNTLYPMDRLYINLIEMGYEIGFSQNECYTEAIDLTKKTGYNNILYFPHQKNEELYASSMGYWLASPHSTWMDCECTVSENGSLYAEDYYMEWALRPVIKLPTSVVNQ